MSILVIHGGAGVVADPHQAAYRAGLKAAADLGHARLTESGDPTAAVLAAVAAMESNDQAFNAGVGGAPTREGRVELDACVMAADGTAGAVAAVTNSRNPILLAEKVRTRTPHVILCGEGAERLETDPVPNDALLTPRMSAALAEWRATGSREPDRGTVGALALSDDGRLSAATSTGGRIAQYAGRLGDTPVPGAGTWSDRRHALSGTGIGEAFLRSAACRTVALRIDLGSTLSDALQIGLDELVAADGDGGFIYLGADGRFGFAYNTRMMAVAYRSASAAYEDVHRDPGVHLFEG